ncbi:DNA modification methylase [Microbacterium sp. NPDC055903]
MLTAATGCTFITPQASTIPYSASDGVNVSDEGAPLAVRNVFVVADESGELGNLIAGIVNPTDDDQVLIVQVSGLDATEIEVPADSTVSLGGNVEPLLIEGLNAKPGATVEIHFQSGDGNGVKANVPVLDGALPYYTDLVPQPTTPVIIDEETATPVPTDAPDEETTEEEEGH